MVHNFLDTLIPWNSSSPALAGQPLILAWWPGVCFLVRHWSRHQRHSHSCAIACVGVRHKQPPECCQWVDGLLGYSLHPCPALQKGNIPVAVSGRSVSVWRWNLTNPSLNEQVFWSLLVNQETDVFRPVFLGFSRHFPDACCLTERWPLHFQPSCRGLEQGEEGGQLQSRKAEPCSEALPVWTSAPCSAVASGSYGCPAARMAGNSGFHLGFHGRSRE